MRISDWVNTSHW